jgi:hypothetical protein
MKGDFKIVNKINLPGYFKKDKAAMEKALTAMGLQLLNNVINGSPSESVVPPIFYGYLRGSGSVFLGKDLLATSEKFGYIESGGKDDVHPNESYSGKNNEITIGFNAPYATKMHETDWEPGPKSKQSGDTGNKFLEKHLMGDGNELFQLYADIYKKEMK